MQDVMAGTARNKATDDMTTDACVLSAYSPVQLETHLHQTCNYCTVIPSASLGVHAQAMLLSCKGAPARRLTHQRCVMRPSLQPVTAAAGMGSQEAILAGLHADAVALMMRLELAAGQSSQEAAAARHQRSLAASLDKRQAQSAIWGKTTTAQQRLDQTRLQKVMHCVAPAVAPIMHATCCAQAVPCFNCCECNQLCAYACFAICIHRGEPDTAWGQQRAGTLNHVSVMNAHVFIYDLNPTHVQPKGRPYTFGRRLAHINNIMRTRSILWLHALS